MANDESIKIAIEAINKASRALNEAKKDFEKFSNSAEKEVEKVDKKFQAVGEKMKSVGKKMSVGLTLPIVGIGTASFKMAADFQDAIGAVDQVFKQNSQTVKDWANNLPTQYGIAEGEALQYATTMGSMLQNIGNLTEKQAAKQSATLLELAGDLTAMYGGRVQDAVRALTGALKGNNTMLDNYGMAVNDALIKTRAMEMGLLREGEQMSLATKQAATLSLIMEQTADAQGQAAREAEGASGQMRSFQTEVRNLGNDIGQILLPVITPLIAKIREAMEVFAGMSEQQKRTIVIVAGVAAALGPLAIAIGTVSTVVGAAIPIIKAAGVAIAFLGGPISLAIAAIGALSVAWAMNMGGIKEKTMMALGAIELIFNDFLSWIKGVGESISKFFEKIGGLSTLVDFSSPVQAIKSLPGILGKAMAQNDAINEKYEKKQRERMKKTAAKRSQILSTYSNAQAAMNGKGIDNAGNISGAAEQASIIQEANKVANEAINKYIGERLDLGEDEQKEYDDTKKTHKKMIRSMIQGNENVLANVQTTVDQMKAKYQELKQVLDQIRAITAPEKGPDNRTDPQVFAISGAQQPVSESVFGIQRVQSQAVAAREGGLAAGTLSTENPININISRVDSPKRVTDIEKAVARVMQRGRLVSS